MGLFDFIKKKLFGKTKKVEESKKAAEKDKVVKKDSSVKEKSKPAKIKSQKKEKKKSTKVLSTKKEKTEIKKPIQEVKKEEKKKGFFSKLKDAIISSPKKEEKVIKEDNIVKEKKDTHKAKPIVTKPLPKQEEPEVEEVVEEVKEEEPEVEEVVEEVEEEEPEVEEVVEEVKEEEPEVEGVVEEVKEEEPEVEEVVEEVKEEEPEVEEVVEEVKEEEPEVEEVVEEVKEEEPEVEEVVEEVKEEEPEVEEVVEEEDDSIKKGLEKTKKSFFSKLKSAIIGKSKIDDDVLDDLEEVLITSDVGVETTVKIIERIEERVSKEKYTSVNELNNILKDEIVKILAENSSDIDAFDVEEDTVPYVILVVGVNGVGKTTTIGKLAAQFKEGGLRVLIGAADTFRAAAVDQILMWGDKVGVDVVSHGMNTDPASVAFDTVKKAVEEKYDVVIIDTAGRLHTKLNLMNELSKIKRVVQKFKPDAPHEVMLILDGSTGQNAFVQAEEFTKATDVNSITITKLDGTAKGGVVIGITDQFKIPIKYIGIGEKIGDLKLFHKGEFVNSFFD